MEFFVGWKKSAAIGGEEWVEEEEEGDSAGVDLEVWMKDDAAATGRQREILKW